MNVTTYDSSPLLLKLDAERDREAIVNFLELLRATLGGLQQPELAHALG